MTELPPRKASPWRYLVCLMLLLATTLNYMDRVTLNQTAARIKVAFNLNNTEYGQLESGFSVAFGIGTFLIGALVDRISVRWVYPLVVFGWSLAGFLTGYAQSYLMLMLFRVMLGFFEAGNWPCGIRTTRQVMPPAERSLGNALFQSGTAIGAIITPFIVLACLIWVDPNDQIRTSTGAMAGGAIATTAYPPVLDAWQIPFRIVGAVGLIWVVAWIVLIPRRVLESVEVVTESAQKQRFVEVFRDRRFWILIVVIIGVNTVWHTFRVWLPLFLQDERGYSEREMTSFMTWYYLTADIGSWTVGLATIALTRAGYRLFTSRMITFVCCAILVLSSLAIPFLARGPWLMAAILATGFGGLGLFATYFTLSQDVSAKHQGKVTGILGCINALFLATIFPLQGTLKDVSGTFDVILSTAWVPAGLAALVVLLFWPRSQRS